MGHRTFVQQIMGHERKKVENPSLDNKMIEHFGLVVQVNLAFLPGHAMEWNGKWYGVEGEFWY